MKSLNVLDSTAGIRRAGRTMKDVIDSQLDKFDTETDSCLWIRTRKRYPLHLLKSGTQNPAGCAPHR